MIREAAHSELSELLRAMDISVVEPEGQIGLEIEAHMSLARICIGVKKFSSQGALHPI